MTVPELIFKLNDEAVIAAFNRGVFASALYHMCREILNSGSEPKSLWAGTLMYRLELEWDGVDDFYLNVENLK